EGGPPWVRLRAKDGKPDEYSLEFDEKILLRFSFQGAEIKIMRFNLKVLSNEFSTYRNLPLSLDSIPKEVQDRLNRDPERFRVLKEPGKFGSSFDLVKRAYEELGGDYFQIERTAPVTPSGPTPRASAPPTSLQSGPFPLPAPAAPAALPPPPLVSESGEHWSEQSPVSDPRDYLPTESRDGEDASASPPAAPSSTNPKSVTPPQPTPRSAVTAPPPFPTPPP